MFLYQVMFWVICAGLTGCVYASCYCTDSVLNFLIFCVIAVELLCLLYSVTGKIFPKRGKGIFLLIFLIVIFGLLFPAGEKVTASALAEKRFFVYFI